MVFNISHNMSYGKPLTSAMRNHRSTCRTYHESGDSNVVRDRHLSRNVWRKQRHWCEGVWKHRCWEVHSGSFEVSIFRDEKLGRWDIPWLPFYKGPLMPWVQPSTLRWESVSPRSQVILYHDQPSLTFIAQAVFSMKRLQGAVLSRHSFSTWRAATYTAYLFRPLRLEECMSVHVNLIILCHRWTH